MKIRIDHKYIIEKDDYSYTVKEDKHKKDKEGLTANQLDQLIDLYQYKLTVLKQLQLEMNKTNNRFKQNRGPVDSTRAYFINI